MSEREKMVKEEILLGAYTKREECDFPFSDSLINKLKDTKSSNQTHYIRSSDHQNEILPEQNSVNIPDKKKEQKALLQ